MAAHINTHRHDRYSRYTSSNSPDLKSCTVFQSDTHKQKTVSVGEELIIFH